MKKSLYTITLFIWAACLLSSCKNEVEDYFDKTASERMEQEIVKYRELLIKPQHGWVMEYYPGGMDQTFGGYALTVSFTANGYAVFRSVLDRKSTRLNSSHANIAYAVLCLKKKRGLRGAQVRPLDALLHDLAALDAHAVGALARTRADDALEPGAHEMQRRAVVGGVAAAHAVAHEAQVLSAAARVAIVFFAIGVRPPTQPLYPLRPALQV